MKKRLSIVVVLAVLGSFICSAAFASVITNSSDAALSSATVIDFESATLGQFTGLIFSELSFNAVDNHLQIANVFSNNYGTTGKYLDNGTYNDMGFFSLTISFNDPTSAFGFNWGAAEPANSDINTPAAIWTLSAFDSSHNLLESYLLPNTGPDVNGAFVGLAFSNISYAKLINSSPNDIAAGQGVGYDWIFIDNFTYATSNSKVPEPSSMLLLGFGLLGAGIMRKRFKG